MIENARKEFIKYVKKFDLKNKNIMGKFHHSFRVMEFSKEIAESLNLNKKDIKLATIIGLLHDIGRFEQWTKYETFIDNKSVDHGDLGSNILKIDDFINHFVSTEEEKKIVLIAIRNHNKYKIEDNLTERELLMSKIIRDADKLDIMKEQGKITKKITFIKSELLEIFDKKELCNNKIVESEIDSILRMLSFIYDLNFKYSYKYLLSNNIIQNKIHLISCYYDNEEVLNNLENKLINYLKERCE